MSYATHTTDPYHVHIPGAFSSPPASAGTQTNSLPPSPVGGAVPSVGFELNPNFTGRDDSSINAASYFSNYAHNASVTSVATQSSVSRQHGGPKAAYDRNSSVPPPALSGYSDYPGPYSNAQRSTPEATGGFYAPGTANFLNPQIDGTCNSTAAFSSAVQSYQERRRSHLPAVSPLPARGFAGTSLGRSGTVLSQVASIDGGSSVLSSNAQSSSYPVPKPYYDGTGYPEPSWMGGGSPQSQDNFVYPEYTATLGNCSSPVSTRSTSNYDFDPDVASDDYGRRFSRQLTNSRVGRSCKSVAQSFKNFSQASKSWWRNR